jgi:hypothetical protein
MNIYLNPKDRVNLIRLFYLRMARCPNVAHWEFFTLNNLAVIQPPALRGRAGRSQTIEFKIHEYDRGINRY